MKHLNKYLSLALALVLCLSLAACGESSEDYGDDGSDYNLYGVPDSFEGSCSAMDKISSWLSSTSPKRTKMPLVTALFHTLASASGRNLILSR